MKRMFARSLSARTITVFGLAMLALLAAMPVSAQEIAHTQFFPILARTSGAGGTQWVSDLTVHNVEEADLEVGIQFLEADQANIFYPCVPDRFPIAAG